jgi:hypothetical protein
MKAAKHGGWLGAYDRAGHTALGAVATEDGRKLSVCAAAAAGDLDGQGQTLTAPPKGQLLRLR